MLFQLRALPAWSAKRGVSKCLPLCWTATAIPHRSWLWQRQCLRRRRARISRNFSRAALSFLSAVAGTDFSVSRTPMSQWPLRRWARLLNTRRVPLSLNCVLPGRAMTNLAGVLAIALRNELLRRGALRHQENSFTVTPKGKHFLHTLEIDADSLRRLRRSFAHKCLDWTERHHHLGGAVGAALLSRFIEMKWLARMRDTRAVRLTHAGEHGFEHVFGIRCIALRARPAIIPE